jgi:hypothetical protein
MTRRAVLLLATAIAARAADPETEVVDLFTDLAGSLSAGNLKRFFAVFDPGMPGYATLRANVTALSAQADLESFIDPLANEATATSRSVELRWTLRIRRGQDATAGVTREETIKAKVEKRGRKWWIIAWEPVAFFAPVN